MRWSNWLPLKEDIVEGVTNLDNPGIYMFRLNNGLFVFEKSAWRFEEKDPLAFSLAEELKLQNLCIGEKTISEIRIIIGAICVYIGKAEKQTLRERLLQHIKQEENPCLSKLMRKGVQLQFRTIPHESKKNYEISKAEEISYYEHFVKNYLLCPPCDCNSRECSRLNSIYIPTLIDNKQDVCEKM